VSAASTVLEFEVENPLIEPVCDAEELDEEPSKSAPGLAVV
jgi:hypothetical protein